jgi:hypothetical protein
MEMSRSLGKCRSARTVGVKIRLWRSFLGFWYSFRKLYQNQYSGAADTGDPVYVICPLRQASDCEWRARSRCTHHAAMRMPPGARTRTGRSVHGARSTERDRYPHKIGDLISYRNSGKGCTQALIGSSEP